MPPLSSQKIVAEVIGTFALTFVGMLAIANDAGLLGIALAHGLTIAVMATALGTISGGQFNPAVSAGLSIAGKQTWRDTLVFVVAQIVGGILGAFVAVYLAGTERLAAVGYGQPAPGQGFGTGPALVAEVITTFFLVLVVLKVAVRQGHAMAGLFVGLTIAIDILAVGPISGGAMNPARVIGPAVASGNYGTLWIYLVGPLVGAALAAAAAQFMWRVPTPPTKPLN